MNAEAVREMLGRRPFEPFEVVMSSGERHAVKHPESLLVSPTRAVILDPVTDKLAILSLMHITELRPTEPQPSS